MWSYVLSVAAAVVLAADPAPAAPPDYRFQIVAIDADRGGTRLIVRVAKRVGVSKTWRGYVIDKADQPVKDSDLVVMNVDDATATVFCKLPPYRIINRYTRVRLEPP